MNQFIKDKTNLVTADLICHGTPSPYLLKEYINLCLLVCLHFYCLHCSSGLEIKIKELGGYGNSEMNRMVVVNGGKRSTSII